MMWSDNELDVVLVKRGAEVHEPVLSVITSRDCGSVSVYLHVCRLGRDEEFRIEISPENLKHIASRFKQEAERIEEKIPNPDRIIAAFHDLEKSIDCVIDGLKEVK